MAKWLKMILVCLLCLSGCGMKETGQHVIVTTCFPCYDFVRAIVGDTDYFDVLLLLQPGMEMHDYDPTPQDMIAINKAELIVCVGGESESWMEDIINNQDKTLNVFKLTDHVNLKVEEVTTGMEAQDEEEEEYDEHVWTSPANALSLIESLSESIVKIDQKHKDAYRQNTSDYRNAIEDVQHQIQEVVNNGQRHTLYFGDRFPLRYFVDEFNLSYYAAFPGCSEQSEPSAKTISFLINQVKQDQAPVVLSIELSNQAIANTIASETNAKTGVFQTIHNVSSEDFLAGKTYVDLMKENIEVLKEALQ